MFSLRWPVLLPALCAFVAFITSNICAYGGKEPSSLPYYDIFTLNTSRIGVNVFDPKKSHGHKNKGNSDGGFFSSIVHHAEHDVHHLVNEAENEAEEAVNDVMQSFAQAIGLKDFYSIHVLDYCDGYFKPNGTAGRHVVSCSNASTTFHFDPTKTLEKELNKTGMDITLDDLHWPSEINDVIEGMAMTFNAMFVLYTMAVICTGLSMFTSWISFLLPRKFIVLGNAGLAGLSWFVLMIASACSTEIAVKATDVINEYGKDIDVNAIRGNKFIALTWVTDIIMLVATGAWFVEWRLLKKKENAAKQYEEEKVRIVG